MVDLTAGTALLAALNEQFNAARQGQPPGRSALIPGLAGVEGQQSPGALNALAGISPGGVPGTATSGSSLQNSLIGGTASATDPLAQSVSDAIGNTFGDNREPGEQPERPTVAGGNADVLLSILTGNPLLMAAVLGDAISGQSNFGVNSADLSNAQPPGSISGFGIESSSNLPGGLSFGGSSFGGSSFGESDGSLSFSGGSSGINTRSDPLTNPAGGVRF